MSVILSMAHEKTIEDWTRKKIGNLLWRATEHGFGADQYQARCFNKVIISYIKYFFVILEVISLRAQQLQ